MTRTQRGLPAVYNATPIVLTDGEAAAPALDVSGRLLMGGTGSTPAAGRAIKFRSSTTITTSTAETTIISAIAATFIDVFRLIIANTSLTACNVTIRDATGGGTTIVFAVPAGETRGFSAGDLASAMNQGTVNNNWTATCSASVTSIIISAEYLKNT